MFNSFLKYIYIYYYWWGYRWTLFVGIFQRAEKNCYKYHCHCLLTDGIVDGLFDIQFFYPLYVIFIDGNTDGMKRVNLFFFIVFSVSKSISKIIIDKFTNIPKITDKLILSVNLSVKFMPTNFKYKY
jgi:hypothetical protein